MKFLSPEDALYLYESIIRFSMKYCCLVRAGAPNCYLKMLGKLQKRICRTVCPSRTVSLESLGHLGNVAGNHCRLNVSPSTTYHHRQSLEVAKHTLSRTRVEPSTVPYK